MKKSLAVLLFITSAVFGFAQGFDDMAYSNSDMTTYFQQETISLMRFQSAYNINVPFFISYSGSGSWVRDDYAASLFNQFDAPDNKLESESFGGIANTEMMVLTGIQIKLSPSLYLPILFCYQQADGTSSYIRDIRYKGETVKESLNVSSQYRGWFLGSGLFLNTERIKGGVYMGWSYDAKAYAVFSPSLYSFISQSGIYYPDTHNNYYNDQFEESHHTITNSFKIALVPMVNTSEWALIGKALDNILGYFGLGDALMETADKGDSKSANAASAINAALDFTFNRIYWGNFSLDMQAMYTRGNFDAAAKADTYGAKLTGLFSNFPFGFTFEGGYKHFYSFAADYFSQGYNNGTGYFNGSMYFPFKHITFGVMYKYDDIYKSAFGIALTSTTFSGLGLLRGGEDTGFAGGDWGLRFRWGGWKAKKE